MYATMPKALVDEIDRLIGRRHRTAFLVKAIEEELPRMKAEEGATTPRRRRHKYGL
jgi:hypothetical protein